MKIRIPRFIGRKLYWKNTRHTRVVTRLSLKYYFIIGKQIERRWEDG